MDLTVSMKNNIIYISFLIFIGYTLSFAQMKKAEKHFANFDYAKAIPAYEKVAKGNSSDKQNAMIKLADCYRILNNYSKAEFYYYQAITIGKVPTMVNYNYGHILKSNNKYSEALKQYYIFLEENKTSKIAENAIKSCLEIKYWESKPKEYEIINIENLNTNRSEFCPVIINNRLVYVAERVYDIVDFEKSATNNQPYLNIFSSEIKNNEIKKGKLLSKKVNSSFHDGPISFTNDGKLAAYTRVNYIVNKKNKSFVNRAKIYFSEINGTSYSNSKPFEYNSDDYSCSHPSLNADGTVLFFSSDMHGTLGGQDIWMCKKNGDSWDKPVNLGFDVNTSGDEVFPSIKKDGMLYFSSNGLPGFGDLDIFTAHQKNGNWLLNRNEGLYLNSKFDDFGITFLNDSVGYFSSNREGGRGADDIYSFKYTNKNVLVDGTVLLTENSNDPAVGVKVFLLDNNEKTIDSTKTDDKGYFVFNNLDVDKTYMAEIEGTDANLKNKSRYYLADKNAQILRITHDNKSGKKFVFKNLPIDPNGMPDLYNDDDLSLAGNLKYGENPSKPVANKKVIIKNEFGDIVEETFTNELGAFAFRNLPLDQNYSITIDDSDLPADAKITLTNKSGKEIKFARSDTKGNFKFSLLGVEKSAISDLSVDDKDLIMALKGYLYDQNKKALGNAKVIIFNTVEVIANIITDDKGKFTFQNLGTDKNYFFGIDDTDPRFASVTKVYVADSRGRIYKELNRNTTGKFQFELIDLDRTALGNYLPEDVLSLTFKNKEKQNTLVAKKNTENKMADKPSDTVNEKNISKQSKVKNKKVVVLDSTMYYSYGLYETDNNGKNILDKIASILNVNPNLYLELISHTDSRSSNSFNMTLSKKRANAAITYLISKGIDKSRLKGVGMGETKLLNNCKNGYDCSEEDHAKNRRTEIKIIEIVNL